MLIVFKFGLQKMVPSRVEVFGLWIVAIFKLVLQKLLYTRVLHSVTHLVPRTSK